MGMELVTLEGEHVRMEPLERGHAAALTEASALDTSLYTWSLVPVGREAVERYIATALAWRDAGTALPFVTVPVRTTVVSLRRWKLGDVTVIV